MMFSPRQLAFLENEMKSIKNDKSRDTEDRSSASNVLGIVQGDLKVAEQTKLNNCK